MADADATDEKKVIILLAHLHIHTSCYHLNIKAPQMHYVQLHRPGSMTERYFIVFFTQRMTTVGYSKARRARSLSHFQKTVTGQTSKFGHACATEAIRMHGTIAHACHNW